MSADVSETHEPPFERAALRDKNKYDLSPEEQILVAKDIKAEAKADYLFKNYAEAARKFDEARSYIEDNGTDGVAVLATTLALNKAMAHVKNGDNEDGKAAAQQVLGTKVSSLHVKAYYWHAMAQLNLSNFKECAGDCVAAAKIDPNNKSVRKLHKKALTAFKAAKAKRKQRYGDMFEKASVYSEKPMQTKTKQAPSLAASERVVEKTAPTNDAAHAEANPRTNLDAAGSSLPPSVFQAPIAAAVSPSPAQPAPCAAACDRPPPTVARPLLVKNDELAVKLDPSRRRRDKNWFESLFGFNESQRGYFDTQASFKVDGDILTSLENRRSYRIGTFACERLGEQRARVLELASPLTKPNGLTLEIVLGDVSRKHAMPENRHATFQVASQLNCLEFVGPSVTPELGVTGYVSDRTQGPACSIACGPATVFRNYFAKVARVDGPPQTGQTADSMINNLADFNQAVGNESGEMFQVRGGYTMAGMRGMQLLSKTLTSMDPRKLDALRDTIRVGVHADVQVTSHSWGQKLLRRWPAGSVRPRPPDSVVVASGTKAAPAPAGGGGGKVVPPATASSSSDVQTVTQVFCSAVAAGYNYSVPIVEWEPFARVLLEAAYEATILAAIEAAIRHWGQPVIKPVIREIGVKRKPAAGARKVFLTLVGGGVFHNPIRWILSSIERACLRYRDYDLQVCIVNYDMQVDPEITGFVNRFERERQSCL